MTEIERLAELYHGFWSKWMKYMFSECYYVREPPFSVIIPAKKVLYWKRLMETQYSELDEQEKGLFQKWSQMGAEDE